MYSAVEGVAQPWHTMHVGSMAVSGAALVIMEATGVEPEGRISPGCLALYNDAQEAALTDLRQSIRSYCDTPIGIQLAHAGRRGSAKIPWSTNRSNSLSVDEGGWETSAPSALPFTPGGPIPKELDRSGMQRVKHAFVQAALRADRCGFDAIEIHGAHGYLLHSFVSPLSNLRTDFYGGDFENRIRFPLEVVSAIRAVWPKYKMMGIRITGDDWHPKGTNIEETVVYARRLKEVGVDYVVVSGGNSAPDINIPPSTPGYMVSYASRVKAGAAIPTMAVGMILTPDQANNIVAKSEADLVCIARGALDDPRWVWHAAAALGESFEYPQPYVRAGAEKWPGYKVVHPKL